MVFIQFLSYCMLISRICQWEMGSSGQNPKLFNFFSQKQRKSVSIIFLVVNMNSRTKRYIYSLCLFYQKNSIPLQYWFIMTSKWKGEEKLCWKGNHCIKDWILVVQSLLLLLLHLPIYVHGIVILCRHKSFRFTIILDHSHYKVNLQLCDICKGY